MIKDCFWMFFGTFVYTCCPDIWSLAPAPGSQGAPSLRRPSHPLAIAGCAGAESLWLRFDEQLQIVKNVVDWLVVSWGRFKIWWWVIKNCCVIMNSFWGKETQIGRLIARGDDKSYISFLDHDPERKMRSQQSCLSQPPRWRDACQELCLENLICVVLSNFHAKSVRGNCFCSQFSPVKKSGEQKTQRLV